MLNVSHERGVAMPKTKLISLLSVSIIVICQLDFDSYNCVEQVTPQEQVKLAHYVECKLHA